MARHVVSTPRWCTRRSLAVAAFVSCSVVLALALWATVPTSARTGDDIYDGEVSAVELHQGGAVAPQTPARAFGALAIFFPDAFFRLCQEAANASDIAAKPHAHADALLTVIFMGFCAAVKGSNGTVAMANRITPNDGTLYLVRDLVLAEAELAMPPSPTGEQAGTALAATSLILSAMAQTDKYTLRSGWRLPAEYHNNYSRLATEVHLEYRRVISDKNTLVLPLGIPDALARHAQYRHEKTMFVDELSPRISDVPESLRQRIWDSFNRSMEIAAELHQRGWRLRTYIGNRFTPERRAEQLRRWRDLYPFVEVQEHRDVATYADHLAWVQQHSFCLLHMVESYGFPHVECLQSGMPVVTFSEFEQPLLLSHGRDAVTCSIHLDPKLCAALVDDFYDRRWSQERFDDIQNNSRRLYAADSYGISLLEMLRLKGILPPL